MPSPRVSSVPAVLLLAIACADRPLDTSATDTTTGTTEATTAPGTSSTTSDGTTSSTTDPTTGPTTGDPSTSSTTSSTSTTSTTSTTDAVSTTDSTGAPPEGDCDLFAQNCPEGQKCMPVSLDGELGYEAARCRPLVDDPDGLGEPCEVLGGSDDGLDTCDEGQFCWRYNIADPQGTCLALCAGAPDDPSCPEPEFTCEIHPNNIAGYCIRPCDPVAQDCPDAGTCVENPSSDGDSFMCLDDASGAGGQAFDECNGLNKCDPGLFCGSSFMINECGGDPEKTCCLPWCDLTAEPDPCPGSTICLQYFAGPPPGLEHVGQCGVPPR